MVEDNRNTLCYCIPNLQKLVCQVPLCGGVLASYCFIYFYFLIIIFIFFIYYFYFFYLFIFFYHFSLCVIISVVNQVEYSPYLQNTSLVEYCRQEGILIEAYSPLTQGKKLKDPVLVDIAAKYVNLFLLSHLYFPHPLNTT